MDIIYGCCAGLDVHKKTVVACVRRLRPDGLVEAQVRTFATMTAALRELADWLAAAGVTHVAMESTGVFWKPVWHALEGRFETLLVNARHLKQVPGRKTDVKDAEWIAQLVQHGLLRPSLVPPEAIRRLRDLTRQRAQLARQRATAAHRIQKVLEDADVKLAAVATDVLGVSGRAMLLGLIAGEADPASVAERARGRLRAKLPALRQALEGRVTDHHRWQLRTPLDQVEQVEALLLRYEARIAELMAPFAAAEARLRTIPGVDRRAAQVLVAETGGDMSRFASAGHLASWAGMCPGNDRSAGRRRSGKTAKGSRWLRAILVQAAWAASHTKDTALAEAYRRWARRLGRKRALVALGHKMLVIVYEMLKNDEDYHERAAPIRAA
jgi:transposase